MLNADSRTLKSESAAQNKNAAPTTPSAAALSCTVRTSRVMSSTGASGSAWLISRTRKLDSPARPVNASRESARNVSGTNASSAKYAIIAARCVPRSAKNFWTSHRFRLRTARMVSSPAVGVADQALADLTEISSQVEAAALFSADGEVIAATLEDAEPFVRSVRNLVD